MKMASDFMLVKNVRFTLYFTDSKTFFPVTSSKLRSLRIGRESV